MSSTENQTTGHFGLNQTRKHRGASLAELLEILKDESDKDLPPGYFALDTIGKQLVTNPSRCSLKI
jgi:hypothetical protein